MAHAERCPVCYGKGVVYGVAENGAFPTTQCYGCQGKGWVTVEDNYPISPSISYYPYYYPNYYPITITYKIGDL